MEQHTNLTETLLQQIKQQVVHRIIEESIPRLLKCLQILDNEKVWYRQNENTNSIGNLIIHLCGNATQWILSTFNNTPDERNRNWEFDNRTIIDKNELAQKLRQLGEDLKKCVETLSLEQITNTYEVQCYTETGTSILIHVVEHFSYHTGQVAYITKLLLNQQIGFYEGQDLTKKKNV